jgi:hypothetical protein
MRLLHTSGSGSRLPSRLGRKLLTGSLPSGGLPCCLLGPRHRKLGKVTNQMTREHKQE